MSTVSGDHVNYTAGGSACSYGDLANYNAPYSLGVAPEGKIVSGAYMVPTWAPISYDSLTQKVPSCSGYSNIESAYGAGADKCQTTYRTSLCGGNKK